MKDPDEEKVIFSELQAQATEEKCIVLPKFFKTGKGQYGEGDHFLGVTVPKIRIVAKQHAILTLNILDLLLASPWHEVRMCALLILVNRFPKATEKEKEQIFHFYLSHTQTINNWDLVDLSAPTIVGGYLSDKTREILYDLAQAPSLWENRIAMVSTIYFIRKDDLEETYRLSLHLLHHPHDLMHKAVGWMLREAGKRNPDRLSLFLEQYRHEMPRTTLRYAIEKFSPAERQHFLKD